MGSVSDESERGELALNAAALSDTLGALSTGKPARKGATLTVEDDLCRIENGVLIDRDHPTHPHGDRGKDEA